MSFLSSVESKELDQTARTQTAGSFVQLRAGFTHYELGGPENGQLVVLVHGFSVPCFIWDPTFTALIRAGFRVLRYDLFGRGYSDRPNIHYTLDSFVRQLTELLDELRLPSSFKLAGLSMGGVIASAFTVQSPARVEKLVLIDPIGTHPMPLNWIYKLAILPGVSEFLLKLAGTESMVKFIASDFFDTALVEEFQERYRVQMQYRGFQRAILSTLRNGVVNGSPETYKRLGKLSVPVLLLWGQHDTTLPLAQSRSILELVPRTEFHVIENTGHVPHYEKPGEVNPILINFLR